MHVIREGAAQQESEQDHPGNHSPMRKRRTLRKVPFQKRDKVRGVCRKQICLRPFNYTLFLGRKQIFAKIDYLTLQHFCIKKTVTSSETNDTVFCSNKCSVKIKRTIYKQQRLIGIKRSVRWEGFSVLLPLCCSSSS